MAGLSETEMLELARIQLYVSLVKMKTLIYRNQFSVAKLLALLGASSLIMSSVLYPKASDNERSRMLKLHRDYIDNSTEAIKDFNNHTVKQWISL